MKSLVIIAKLFSGIIGKFKGINSNTIKNLLIISMILLAAFFAYKWYYKDDNAQLLKKLQDEGKSIQAERNRIQSQIDSIESINKTLSGDKSELVTKISDDGKVIDALKDKAKMSQKDLDKIRAEVEKNRQDIQKVVNTPANREGDSLLISLRNHLDKRMKNKK